MIITSRFSLFLIHLWIQSISCAVYHIVPSPSHDCPVESCLTLSSFAANVSLYLDSNTSLIFQPGNHTACSQVNITNIAGFIMTSYSITQSSVAITCSLSLISDSISKLFNFEAVEHVYITNLKFFGYKSTILKIGPDDNTLFLITVILSNLTLFKCTFENNKAALAISTRYSNITISQSTFSNNSEFSQYLLHSYSCNVMIINSTFIGNEQKLILMAQNEAAKKSILNTLKIIGCEFRNNDYQLGSDIIYVSNSDIAIVETKSFNNTASPFLSAIESSVNISRSIFKYNDGTANELIECKGYIITSIYDSCNQYHPGIYNHGALTLYNTIVHIQGSDFKNNIGRGIYGATSVINFSETCTLTYNQAEEGGAIFLIDAKCFIAYGATVIIANNTASADGGGMYFLHTTTLTLHSHGILHILENRAAENGGGIFMSAHSSISLNVNNQTLNSTIHFDRNHARKGGGLCLGLNSTLSTFTCLNNSIKFDNNSAEYGGAVYVFTASTIMNPYVQECFFQPQPFQNPVQRYDTRRKCSQLPFQFSFNTAKYSGRSIFKERFENCSINGKSINFNEFTILSSLTDIQISDIGSFHVQVCFCEAGRLYPDCSRQPPFFNIKTGERLTLHVAIADRGNHAVNGSIESEIRGSVLIRDDEKIQNEINGCSALIFNIFSFEISQTLIMSPLLETQSTYIITKDSKRSVKLHFLACIDCPIGFQQEKNIARGCDCVCDEILGSYNIINCNYTRETVTKRGTTTWITYLSGKNTSGYLTYPYCPMDYCFPPDATVEINLNIPNGADAQCIHNHSGLLCGACSSGLSLSLGSSQCLQCHTHWPGVLVAIIVSTLLAGIVLVTSLLILNLTVATGTLNGLIFYANIVAANQHKFFPSTSFVTVAISWLNLELGIDTCFFDGMDFYGKTWIQLAFPAYILLLVVLVIIISEHSVKFAKIVAKWNPLATLNTLILLSYVKFLRTVILVFSFATLYYPDGSHHVVWWPDATVGYFSGKHVVLWITAALILVAGIFYTAILFSWQWLLYYQHKKIFKWIIQNQRLCMFVEPNHAPYAFKHRYWAGLLLLVRAIVYTISSADVSISDRTVTLLAIGIIIFLLTNLLCLSRPYKSKLVLALELICCVNIVCLCFVTFFVSNREGKSQDMIAYISGTVSLVLFLVVVMYHIIQVIAHLFFTTRLGKRIRNKSAPHLHGTKTEQEISLVVQGKKNDKLVTYSEVAPPEGEEETEPLSDLDNLTSRTNALSGSVSYEENELRPLEHKVTDSSTPYILMK